MQLNYNPAAVREELARMLEELSCDALNFFEKGVDILLVTHYNVTSNKEVLNCHLKVEPSI